MEKRTASGIMLTLLLTSIWTLAFKVQFVEAEPKTWIVYDDGPADFHTIQEAINAANSEDTVHVRAGMYYENLVVDKNEIALLGENEDATIIDGSGTGNRS